MSKIKSLLSWLVPTVGFVLLIGLIYTTLLVNYHFMKNHFPELRFWEYVFIGRNLRIV